MKKIYLLLTFILTTSCNNSTTVVFLGDSITENATSKKGDTLNFANGSIQVAKYTGFITQLKESVGEDIELIGRGIGGDKVSNLLERYKEDVLSLNPDIVFIYIGINDVWHKYDFGTGTDIIFYENGLRKIIGDLKNNGARVILCTPTVIGENKGEFTLVNKFKDIETMEIMNGDLDAYSDVIRKLSSELDTDLVDLREVFMNYISENNPNNSPSGITTYDGVHLNDLGNKLIATINGGESFEWNSNPNVAKYLFQISLDSDISSLINETNTENNFISLKDLSSDTTYFWRVASVNECGVSEWSDISSFVTAKITNNSYVANNLPLSLNDANIVNNQNVNIGYSSSSIFISDVNPVSYTHLTLPTILLV